MDASLLPSDLPDFADQAAVDEWLIAREEALADLIARRLTKIVGDAYRAFLRSLTPEVIIAAGDLLAFEEINPEWALIIEEEITPYIEETYYSGAMSAVTVAGGVQQIPASTLVGWANVINTEAITYLATAANRLTGVGDTVYDMIRSKTVKAIGSGASNEDLKNELSKIAGFSEFRADVVARTEVSMAYASGDWTGMQALGEYGPVEKEWFATNDARTRESHRAMNGVMMPIDQPFQLPSGASLMYARQPGGVAGEVINCRCKTLYYFEGDIRPDGTTVTRQLLADQLPIAPVSVPSSRLSQDDIDMMRAEIHAAQRKARPLLREVRAIEDEMNKDSFWRKPESWIRIVQSKHRALADEVKPVVKAANDGADEVMTALWEVVDDLPEVAAQRWRDVTLERGARVVRSDAEIGTPKWRRARDRYVVADTPTLEMNKAMRGQTPMTPAIKTRVREAQYLTEGVLVDDSLVSRSMELPIDTALELKPGATWTSKGFQSTQAKTRTPYSRRNMDPGRIHTEATIRLPKGTNAADLDYDEIVLRPGTMRVLSSRWDGSTLHVLMEWIG